LASLLVLSYLLIFRRSSLRLVSNHLLPLALYGFLGMYLTNALEFWSLQYLSSAKTCFLYSLSPFFAAFFSYLYFGERMNLRKWVGMGIGFLGIMPVLLLQKGSERSLSAFFCFSWPELAMVGAVLSSVYGWVLLRRLVRDEQSCTSLTANGIGMLIGGLFALTHSALTDSWKGIFLSNPHTSSVVQGILFLTLLSNVFCYSLYGWLLKRFTATFLSFAGLMSPLFASFHGWFFLSERPSSVIFFSMGIVAIGLWLIYSAELKQGLIRKEVAQ
jgi:drug/metabolite transporter (DMT)-like permease